MKQKIKTYYDLPEMFADGLIQHSDILVFFGKRGTGKTSLQTFFNVLFMQPRNAKADIRKSKALCDRINMTGLSLRPPEDHLVFVDTYAESVGHGLKRNRAYEFSSLDFGLPNEKHPTGLLCPVGKYSFDEGQGKFDSHMGSLAIFLSMCMELSRHPELFIMIAMQRPKRLPLDIRDLSTFIEPIERKDVCNKYGRLIRTEWTCRIFYKNKNLEKYLDGDGEDDTLADKVVKFVFEGNIYRCYDANYFLPMFYVTQGTKTKSTTLELNKCKKTEYTQQGFDEFHTRHTVDIPDTYRGKVDKDEKAKRRKDND